MLSKKNPKDAARLKSNKKVLINNLGVLQAKLAKITQKKKVLFTATKQQIVRAGKIKKDIYKTIKTNRCIALEKKLQKLIKVASTLNNKFIKACKGVKVDKVPIAKEIKNITKKIVEIKIKIAKKKQECEEELAKNRKLTKVVVNQIAVKLKMSEDQAILYKKMLEQAKKEALLKRKAAALKIRMMTENNEEIKRQIAEKIKQIQAKTAEIKKQQEEARKAAEKMQKDMEKREQDLMKAQKDAAEAKRLKLLEDKKKLQAKMMAIKNAMKMAHDKNIKKALAAQKLEEEKKNVEA